MVQKTPLVAGSGDDVGGQTVFDAGDQVFQHQFALFQALQGQLIARAFAVQRVDSFVQVAVFVTKDFQLDTQDFLAFHRNIRERIHVGADSTGELTFNIGFTTQVA